VASFFDIQSIKFPTKEAVQNSLIIFILKKETRRP
jgi:hypothetical protein